MADLPTKKWTDYPTGSFTEGLEVLLRNPNTSDPSQAYHRGLIRGLTPEGGTAGQVLVVGDGGKLAWGTFPEVPDVFFDPTFENGFLVTSGVGSFAPGSNLVAPVATFGDITVQKLTCTQDATFNFAYAQSFIANSIVASLITVNESIDAPIGRISTLVGDVTFNGNPYVTGDMRFNPDKGIYLTNKVTGPFPSRYDSASFLPTELALYTTDLSGDQQWIKVSASQIFLRNNAGPIEPGVPVESATISWNSILLNYGSITAPNLISTKPATTDAQVLRRDQVVGVYATLTDLSEVTFDSSGLVDIESNQNIYGSKLFFGQTRFSNPAGTSVLTLANGTLLSQFQLTDSMVTATLASEALLISKTDSLGDQVGYINLESSGHGTISGTFAANNLISRNPATQADQVLRRDQVVGVYATLEDLNGVTFDPLYIVNTTDNQDIYGNKSFYGQTRFRNADGSQYLQLQNGALEAHYNLSDGSSVDVQIVPEGISLTAEASDGQQTGYAILLPTGDVHLSGSANMAKLQIASGLSIDDEGITFPAINGYTTKIDGLGLDLEYFDGINNQHTNLVSGSGINMVGTGGATLALSANSGLTLQRSGVDLAKIVLATGQGWFSELKCSKTPTDLDDVALLRTLAGYASQEGNNYYSGTNIFQTGLTSGGTTNLTGAVNIGGKTTLNGDIEIHGAVTVSGATINASGNTINANFHALSTNTVKWDGTPTDANDLTTKEYVDGLFAAATGTTPISRAEFEAIPEEEAEGKFYYVTG